jgi:hypothetical protein
MKPSEAESLSGFLLGWNVPESLRWGYPLTFLVNRSKILSRLKLRNFINPFSSAGPDLKVTVARASLDIFLFFIRLPDNNRL